MSHNSKPAAHRRGDVGVRQWREAGCGPFTRRRNIPYDKPVAKIRLRPGVVVWAHVQYVEQDGWKTRPAVVVGVDGRSVFLFPGSSADSRWRYPEEFFEVSDPAASGLTRSTGFRRRRVEVDIVDVVDVVGVLSDVDATALLSGQPGPCASGQVAA